MIFVTGGTGLLGSHLLVELTKTNDRVCAIYRSNKKRIQLRKLFEYYFDGSWKQHYDKIKWVKGDIIDIPFLQAVINENDFVYHCAALVSFDRKDFNSLNKINTEGTSNIVNVCLDKKVKKLCYVSSTAAIGGSDSKIITEESKWKKTPTTTGYSVSKYSAEKEVWRGIEEGLNAVMVNPCVILGAGHWDDSSLTIFRTLKKGMKFFPSGSNAIVDARDVTSIMIQLMNSDIHSERYLCIGNNQSFKHLMESISKGLNVTPPTIAVNRTLVTGVRYVLAFIAFVLRKRPSITKESVNSLFGHRKYSSAKIQAELNFSFKTLEETIENSIKGRIN